MFTHLHGKHTLNGLHMHQVTLTVVSGNKAIMLSLNSYKGVSWYVVVIAAHLPPINHMLLFVAQLCIDYGQAYIHQSYS